MSIPKRSCAFASEHRRYKKENNRNKDDLGRNMRESFRRFLAELGITFVEHIGDRYVCSKGSGSLDDNGGFESDKAGVSQLKGSLKEVFDI